ncbi:MAG: tetratricopeptide repeat protein [Desulfomonilaceae bacterium]|nr:tetratricopeptide repeat protein [Desulfomonilaceae bacterium]
MKEAVESHNAGRTKEAIEIYTEILEKNPRSAEVLNWRGMAYDDLGTLDQALADLNKAIELSPNYADAYNNRGEVYRKKQMYPKAKADYAKAVALDKQFAEAHYNLALVLEHEKNHRGAAQELGKYLALKPNAEDKKEIEEKIKALSTPAPAAKPDRPPAGAKPSPRTAAKPAERPGVAPKKLPVPAQTEPPVPGIPGLEQLPIPSWLPAVAGAMGIFFAVIPLVVYIFGAVMLFLIAKKTATSLPWLAFIPIVNIFLMLMIAGKPIWWLALLLLPVLTPVFGMLAFVDPTDGLIPLVLSGIAALVSIAAWLFICIGIAQARGKSVIWGVLLFIPCTSPIALGYLGLSR